MTFDPGRRELMKAAAAGVAAGALGSLGGGSAQAEAGRARPSVKVAGYDYDRVRAIMDGRVGISDRDVFFHVDAGIEEPGDLRGKPVGTPGYGMSANTWIRGLLLDEYGVKPRLQPTATSSGARSSGTTRTSTVSRLTRCPRSLGQLR